MKLTDYRKKRGISQAGLARMLCEAGYPATQGLVSFWELGRKKITAERALQLEIVTNGGLTRNDLRPDIFGELSAVRAPSESGALAEPVEDAA